MSINTSTQDIEINIPRIKELEREKHNTHTHITGLSIREKLIKRENPKTKEAFIRVIDDPRIRIKTKNKIPRRGNKWQNWYEKLTWNELKGKNGEAGARTGKPVKYRGRDYYFYVFDSDQGKDSHNLPVELQREISEQNKKLAEKWGTAYNKTKHGDHFYILSKEKLPKDLIIKYKGRKCAELLGLGKQAQVEGINKEWQPGHRPFRIIKNTWGLCQILNRKDQGWSIKESHREKQQQIIRKEQPTNINIYQPLNISENIRRFILKDIKLGKHQRLRRAGRPIFKKTYWKNGRKGYFMIDTKYSGGFDETILDRLPEREIRSIILAQGIKHQFFKQLWTEP